MATFRVKCKFIKSEDPSRKFGPPLNAWDKVYAVQERCWLFFWKIRNVYENEDVANSRKAFLDWYEN